MILKEAGQRSERLVLVRIFKNLKFFRYDELMSAVQ